jgi:hypothetical protein
MERAPWQRSCVHRSAARRWRSAKANRAAVFSALRSTFTSGCRGRFSAALHEPLNNFADPQFPHWEQSDEFVVMAVPGGRGTFWRPPIGAATSRRAAKLRIEPNREPDDDRRRSPGFFRKCEELKRSQHRATLRLQFCTRDNTTPCRDKMPT